MAMKGSGLDMNKQVLTAHDGRVSDLCKRLSGQTVGLNEKFLDKVTGQEWETAPFHVNCFIKDTKIRTSKGIKNIQDIKVGDKVLTHKNRLREVVEVMSRETEDYYELEVGTNKHKRILKVTANHPILTQRGWVSVKDLNSEDFVVEIK